MNRNQIKSGGFSNPDSEALYDNKWPADYCSRNKYETGLQCGGCSFYAPINSDWGLCCHPKSRHRFETVFEHFTCPDHVNEGWEQHSFSENPNDSCNPERNAYVPKMSKTVSSVP
jgi:hypothetical protein